MKEFSKNKTANNVYQVVQSIPKGKVMTYKQVAILSGIKNPRQVGQILHENPDPKNIPCHRVIRSDGKIAEGFAFGGKFAQADYLKKERVTVKNNSVKLSIFAVKSSLFLT